MLVYALKSTSRRNCFHDREDLKDPREAIEFMEEFTQLVGHEAADELQEFRTHILSKGADSTISHAQWQKRKTAKNGTSGEIASG